MLTEPTVEKLKSLRLDALADAWAAQQKDPDTQKLSFDERLGMLIDAEWLARENRRLGRLLKEAKLRIGSACVEDIDYPPRRELEKSTIRQLATCRWIAEHQNVVITGMTGTGKTTSPALSPSRPAARAAAPSTAGPPASPKSWLSPTPTAPTPSSSPASPGPTSSSSTTGASRRPRTRSDAISSRSSRTAAEIAPLSSPARSPPPSGTTTSAIPWWPTPSATASSTTPTASC